MRREGGLAEAASPRLKRSNAKLPPAPDGARKLNAQDSDGAQVDRQPQLITRLARERADRFSGATKEGILRRSGGEVSFGPTKDGTYYFLSDKDSVHSFVIPAELTEGPEQRLKQYPADRHVDVLAVYSTQYALYDKKDATFLGYMLKRAVSEMNHGNLGPLGSFAAFVPTMIAADVVKGLIQGGGTLLAT